MPPDADKLRWRQHGKQVDTAVPSVSQERICSLASLKASEVCIDGTIYDITDFNHPGGDSIHIFGGNDVTVQYKMIHPYHTEKHLDKLSLHRVGTVINSQADYKFDTPFEREIKHEVFKIVPRGREFATPGFIFRLCCYVTLYFYLQYLWIVQGSWQLAIIYGLAQATIGLNVQHDANHGAISKQPFWNSLFGLGADFIGGSKWLWMEKHWTHHAYTNHESKDPDCFAAEPMLLWNDYPKGHPKRKWYHSFQHIFGPVVLAGYWLSEVFNPQLLDLRNRGSLDVGMKSDYIKQSRKYSIALRILYIYVHMVCPMQLHGVSWSTIGGILLMGASGSLGISILFILSHNFDNCVRNPTNADEQICWFKSQVETSCTYGGAFSGYLTGGLNFQVEHHLFPRMSSAWYPYIAPKVREVCAKHGVRYVYYPWLLQNLCSTIKYVHDTGTGNHWENPGK